MLSEIREMGFTKAELSHGVRMSLVPGILRAIEEDLIEISSIHNFCPLPSAVDHPAPNLFQPSTRRKLEATMWHRYTKRTMDFARQVKTKKIVIHSGSAAPPIFQTIDFASIKGNGETVTFEKLLHRLQKRSAKPTARVIERFTEIHTLAEEHGLQFGVENREGVFELPLDSQADTFFKELPQSETFCYWHDTGHAELKDRLGLLNHRKHLESMSSRLIGFHLHDVDEEGHDHQIPGTGTVDFSMIKGMIEPHHTLVLELSPRLSKDDVLASREYLLETLN